MLDIQPSAQSCGASVRGIDLSQPLEPEEVTTIRRAWLEHKVLSFPDQQLSDADLERLTLDFGVFGDEPFFVPIDGSEHVVALTRRADEKAPVFAESWHSDWSFEDSPPIGTCLYSLVVPPVGGDTEFINQEMALAEMPAELRIRLEGRQALHSAAAGYAPDGLYGERDRDSDRSMQIRTSEEARRVRRHPFIIRHPETGVESLYGCFGYICGVEGLDDGEAKDLLLELYKWQTRDEFQYRHKWQPNMFVMWDNRALLHRATGGYDGHARELHRTTIRDDPGKHQRLPGAAPA